VRANQGETVQVVTYRIDIHLPAINRVAILACRSKLAAMDVSMAISALLTDVSENFLHMARITCDILVETAQRILGFTVVIELDHLPKRGPARRRVAVFAGDGKRPVGIARLRRLGRLRSDLAPDYQAQGGKNDRPTP
jgi:hypothetical protein